MHNSLAAALADFQQAGAAGDAALCTTMDPHIAALFSAGHSLAEAEAFLNRLHLDEHRDVVSDWARFDELRNGIREEVANTLRRHPVRPIVLEPIFDIDTLTADDSNTQGDDMPPVSYSDDEEGPELWE